MVKNIGNKIYVGVIIILLLILIYIIIWGAFIVPKQIEFNESCEDRCEIVYGEDYVTEFRSLPFLGLNGKCYCVDKTEEKI